MTFLITKRHRIGGTTGSMFATCRPQVVASVLTGRRGCRECPLTRVKTAATMKTLNISKTAVMRALLRGLAAAGSAEPPAVAPKPIVPTVETTTAPHSAACSLSCNEHTVKHKQRTWHSAQGQREGAPSGKSGRKRPARPDLIQTQAEQLTPIQDRQLQYVPGLRCSLLSLPIATVRNLRGHAQRLLSSTNPLRDRPQVPKPILCC